MRFKNLVYVSAAMFLLAACASDPKVEQTQGGGGSSSPATPAKAAPKVSTSSVVPGSAQDLIVNVGDRVFFALDKSDLSPQARGTLERQSAWLKRFPRIVITVEGHADERGTREYNLGPR